MTELTSSARSFGLPLRGISQSDVSHAADSLLRAGERPTNDKVRAKIGKGSLSTINPLLDSWWKTLAVRLDSGPAALHRLPEAVVHVAEALWMQALEESRRRISIEQRDTARVAELDKQRLELRSHVLTLREGELDSRLRDRERTIEELNLRLRELTGLLQKEQATRQSLTRRLNHPALTATQGVAERPNGEPGGRPRPMDGARRAAPNSSWRAAALKQSARNGVRRPKKKKRTQRGADSVRISRPRARSNASQRIHQISKDRKVGRRRP